VSINRTLAVAIEIDSGTWRELPVKFQQLQSAGNAFDVEKFAGIKNYRGGNAKKNL
jgi:hypothetical protein